jgi:hypothetical protein
MRVEEMTQGGIAADEDDLLKGMAETALLQQPEQTFHRDVDDAVFGFLAGCTVDDMGNAAHRCAHNVAVSDIAAYRLQSRLGFKTAVVAQSANGHVVEIFAGQQALDEMSSYLARRAGYEDVLHLLASFVGIFAT